LSKSRSAKSFMNITRRTLLAGTPAIASLGFGVAIAAETPVDRGTDAGIRLTLNVNRKAHALTLDPRVTVLDALREHLQMTGSKKGCDQGQCGACTVLIDGKRTLSCLTLAVAVQGKSIETIEGLADADGTLHPMQQAFIDHDAFQCGYCTPGQILSAIACVHEAHARTDEDIREYMSGNLCRCAAYPNIVLAIKDAREKMKNL
jgi:xanthine dehydrogenase YagT iron-sulfur-binding subunit